ncbi:MAG: DNA mismatch repair endonuclease MutL [Muribaculaceae bacterium]|nr:DNA mismatch repair endonuclease MutL [Muribaculaceae bacterium]
MSDVIRLLPDSVANQIAAGEVIQRPASVIKELVENAVDAGATEIRIYIKDAGRTLIQVVDNGCGMSETDARMAFERHATSKIAKADDLFSLHTMGFRGEALPSICAISRVEVRTSTADNSMGTQLVISGSHVESQTPVMCDRGTSIMVKNLFFNVPARRKFLKSDNVELSNIMREFERLALVNNRIRMSIDTGTRVIDLRAGTFKQRIADLWKNNLNMTLLPVDIDTSIVKISGFVSRPEAARRRNPLQYLIVNGRNMRHPYFHKAILSCYESLIAMDTQPCYFLKFEVDPATIDVNIHPTKHEIKFENELEIRPLLVAAVRASLGKNAAVPSIDFNDDPLAVAPFNPDEKVDLPEPVYPQNYNPFTAEKRGGGGGFGSGHDAAERTNLRNWSSLYADFMRQTRKEFSETPSESDMLLPEIEEDGDTIGHCFQYAGKYIVASIEEGVIIIDQHRAHTKILYEEIMEKVGAGTQISQHVLFPETMHLDAPLMVALEEIGPELRRLGFLIEPQSEGIWAINGVPPLSRLMGNSLQPLELVLRILETVAEGGENYGKEGKEEAENLLISRMALLMAKSSAIEKGRVLNRTEMETLIKELFKLPDPSYSPLGNTIFTLLDTSRLESLLP